MTKSNRGSYLFFFVTALASLIFSFYQSEILKYFPTPLLWYQRMMFIPILFISGIGILRFSYNQPYYFTLFGFLGTVCSISHYLLQKSSLLGKDLECLPGENCYVDIEWAGFITTPLIFAILFALILLSSLFTKGSKK